MLFVHARRSALGPTCGFKSGGCWGILARFTVTESSFAWPFVHNFRYLSAHGQVFSVVLFRLRELLPLRHHEVHWCNKKSCRFLSIADPRSWLLSKLWRGTFYHKFGLSAFDHIGVQFWNFARGERSGWCRQCQAWNHHWRTMRPHFGYAPTRVGRHEMSSTMARMFQSVMLHPQGRSWPRYDVERRKRNLTITRKSRHCHLPNPEASSRAHCPQLKDSQLLMYLAIIIIIRMCPSGTTTATPTTT